VRPWRESLLRPEPGFECAPRVLLALTTPDFEFLRAALSFAHRQSLFLSRVLFDERGALAGPALGAPQAVMLLENLAAAGGRRILVLGWAGALDPELSPGGLLLPETAYSLEGTSRHYLPRRRIFRPSARLFREIRGLLEDRGLCPALGAVVSTDAPYREDRAFLRRWSGRTRAVDMETSALLAAAEALGLELAVLLLISDALEPSGRKKAAPGLLREVRRKLLPVLRTFLEG